MALRFQDSFRPVNSTAPSFESTLGTTSQFYALESSAISRVWQGPTGNAIRIASAAANDFYVKFGSTTAVAASSDSTLVLGGTVEVFRRRSASDTHIAIAAVSTDVQVNVTIGYGS